MKNSKRLREKNLTNSNKLKFIKNRHFDMGNCAGANGNKKIEVVEPLRSRNPKTHSFNLTHSDMIKEKHSEINLDYNFVTTLGKGAFGEVIMATNKTTGIVRAIKIINKDKQQPNQYTRMLDEIKILKTLDHPHIMKIIEFYQDDQKTYIVNEFYEGGELLEKISKKNTFTEAEAASLMNQIISAVNYCHKNKIVHRDLKPENIVFETKDEDSVLKVIDFGTSEVFSPGQLLHKPMGTCYYVAPEVLLKRYTEKCDVWSCGVIMYFILCGHPPFYGSTEKRILEKVVKGLYEFKDSEWDGISEDAKDLIRKMLEYSPEKRLSAEEALNHPWFTKILGDNAIGNKNLAVKTMKNLENFRAGRKLQEAIWIFLVTYFSTKEDKGKLLETFRALDKDKNGTLSREEIKQGYKLIMGKAHNDEDIEVLIKNIDTNKSGSVDYSEFVTATINRINMLSQAKLEAAFKLFDKNGDGYLTVDELKEFFNPEQLTKKQPDPEKETEEEISEEDMWKELMQEVDVNGDGKISLKEFKDMMLKMLK